MLKKRDCLDWWFPSAVIIGALAVFGELILIFLLGPHDIRVRHPEIFTTIMVVDIVVVLYLVSPIAVVFYRLFKKG